jgi:hypothetical protein
MTTPVSDFHRLMEQTFFAGRDQFYPGTKIYTPNAKWKEPQNENWFAFYNLSGDTFNASLKPLVERTAVVLHISVYTPVETYERSALEMAETAARWFANKDFKVDFFQDAKFRAANIKTSPDPKTGKFRVIATVPGWRDVRNPT